MAKTSKVTKKKVVKVEATGRAYVSASFNNVIVSLTNNEGQDITCPSLLVRDTMTLLKLADTYALPVASTLTTFFFVTLEVFAIIRLITLFFNYYLVAFFLFATVFLFPLRVLALFLV